MGDLSNSSKASDVYKPSDHEPSAEERGEEREDFQRVASAYELLEEFLKEYSNEKYREMIRRAANSDSHVVTIDASDLATFSKELLNLLREAPDAFLRLAEGLVHSIARIEGLEPLPAGKEIHVRIRGFGREDKAVWRSIREITVMSAGRLVATEGYIADIQQAKMEVPEAEFVCEACGYSVRATLEEGAKKTCPRCGSYLHLKTSSLTDARPEIVRLITIEEPPEDVPRGGKLERIDVILVGEDLAYCPGLIPGAKVKVVGIVRGAEGRPLWKGREKTREVYIEAVGIEALYYDKKPNAARIAEAFVKYFTRKTRIIAPMIREYSGDATGSGKGGVLGIFCYEDGAYVECKNKLLAELKDIYDKLHMDRKGVSYSSLERHFLASLEAEALTEVKFNPKLILFKNGVLDWDDLLAGRYELKKPSPDMYILYRVPGEIDIETLRKCMEMHERDSERGIEMCAESEAPNTTNFYKSLVGELWIKLYEFDGYDFCTWGYPFHKVLLVGRHNVSNVPFDSLNEGRFDVVNLYGKMVNLGGELPDRPPKDLRVFKQATGEDLVYADRKFRDAISFYNTAKMYFTANKLPAIVEPTEAFWRRWIVIEFPFQFKYDPEVEEKFLNPHDPELPKVRAIAIAAFLRVLKRKGFSFASSTEEVRELWQRESDSVYAFISAMEKEGFGGYRLVRDPNGKVHSQVLYDLYKDFCKEEGFKSLDKSVFTRRLKSHGIEEKKLHDAKYYLGVRLEPMPREEAEN